MSGLQHELPSDVPEDVFARLPVHVLCRFRVVCKRWNHLLTQPELASLCAQAPRRTQYALASPEILHFSLRGRGRVRRPMNTGGRNRAGMNLSRMSNRRNWDILDMVGKRFYSLSDSFMDDYLIRSLNMQGDCDWTRQTLAADGGLIYAQYDFYGSHHVVCNPLRKSFVRIVDPFFCLNYAHHIVVMSVDRATQRFRIVVMDAENRVWDSSGKVHLYDSTAARWRLLCEVPAHHLPRSCVFLKGVFYTLLEDSSEISLRPKLFSCNLETGAWSHIDVTLRQPSHFQDKEQLVVSSDRLFFVEYTGVPNFPYCRVPPWTAVLDNNHWKVQRMITVRLSEILLAEKEVIRVGEELNYSEYTQWMLDHPYLLGGKSGLAVGCGDWIVISSLLRRRVGYDLVKKDWYELPADPGHTHGISKHGACDYRGTYGGVVDLDLRELIGEIRPREDDDVINSRSDGASGS